MVPIGSSFVISYMTIVSNISQGIRDILCASYVTQI